MDIFYMFPESTILLKVFTTNVIWERFGFCTIITYFWFLLILNQDMFSILDFRFYFDSIINFHFVTVFLDFL